MGQVYKLEYQVRYVKITLIEKCDISITVKYAEILSVVKPFVRTAVKQNSMIFNHSFSSCHANMISHSCQEISTESWKMSTC
jgi:hypothetical protein